jgi:hypothetical protein
MSHICGTYAKHTYPLWMKRKVVDLLQQGLPLLLRSSTGQIRLDSSFGLVPVPVLVD